MCVGGGGGGEGGVDVDILMIQFSGERMCTVLVNRLED